MSDQHDDPVDEPRDDLPQAPAEEPVPDSVDADDAVEDATEAHDPVEATGHPAVDEVLRSLDALDGRPVEEHVAAFEDAHEQLRRALSSAGDDSP